VKTVGSYERGHLRNKDKGPSRNSDFWRAPGLEDQGCDGPEHWPADQPADEDQSRSALEIDLNREIDLKRARIGLMKAFPK